ncbi:MAG: hypothetical protein RBU36_18445 [Thermoanaerobaculia bacterium]|jgi:hypothetical protein|nr:hypothetical protein [Thermoanaerobaculia bacterium]
MPRIEGPDRAKPLSYDPKRDKLITFDEILSGDEPIIPVDQLTESERVHLVIERQRAGPDYRVQAMSGSPMSRDDVIEAIRRGDDFGRATVEADLSHLRDLLAQIGSALK